MNRGSHALASLALGALVISSTLARADAPMRFALAIHAVSGVPAEFVRERVATANQLFAAAGVAFDVGSESALPDRHRTLTTRADRDALGAYHTRRAIDVFVVESLVDVDTPPLPRRGVHWRDRTRRGVRYVIVIASSSRWVLPHELGHYFGNGHSNVRGNLMSYERGDGDPFLSTTQLARIRRSARALAPTMRTRF